MIFNLLFLADFCKPKTALFQLSGGITSWAAARRYRDNNPDSPYRMVFADTFIESEDVYKFLIAGASDIAGVARPEFWDSSLPPPINLSDPEPRKKAIKKLARASMKSIPNFDWIWDGRTPWEVFKDGKFIGNSRVDPCSKILKRDLLATWRRSLFNPGNCVTVVGLNFDEDDRVRRIKERGHPWVYETPLADANWRSKEWWVDYAVSRGLPKSNAYVLGLAHDNCGGGCCKAGMGHWAQILEHRPWIYAEWESEELATIQLLGKKVTMLKCRRGGGNKPLSLRDLRHRIEGFDLSEEESLTLRGCSCALDV